MEYQEFEKIAKILAHHLENVPRKWDAKSVILEMKNAGSKQWRQMEWMGFYFEFLCDKLLSSGTHFAARDEKGVYGNVQFDGFFEIPWDYKVHATNTSSHHVIVNDRVAIESAVEDYGVVGVIMAIGDVEYNDENRTFQKWHSELKGGKSDYEKKRIKRGAWSRRRKTKFTLKQILFIKIDSEVLENAGSFQGRFRNADGSPRKEKILLDLEALRDSDFYCLDFE